MAVYRDIPEELRNAIEPVVTEYGLELMNVQTSQDRGVAVLRVTLDSELGDGRIPVDRLAKVSREVESSLDAAEALQPSGVQFVHSDDENVFCHISPSVLNAVEPALFPVYCAKLAQV